MKLQVFKFNQYSSRAIINFSDACLLKRIEFVHCSKNNTLTVTFFNHTDFNTNPGLSRVSNVLLNGLATHLTCDQGPHPKFSFVSPSLPLADILREHDDSDTTHAHSDEFKKNIYTAHDWFPHTHIEYQNVTNPSERIGMILQMLIKLDHSLKNEGDERERFYRYSFNARFEHAIHPDYSPLDPKHTLATCVDRLSDKDKAEADHAKATHKVLSTSFAPKFCDLEDDGLSLAKEIEDKMTQDLPEIKPEEETHQKKQDEPATQKIGLSSAVLIGAGVTSAAFFAHKVVRHVANSDSTCTLQ